VALDVVDGSPHVSQVVHPHLLTAWTSEHKEQVVVVLIWFATCRACSASAA
jgi:hypothetical protein